MKIATYNVNSIRRLFSSWCSIGLPASTSPM